MKFIVLVAAFAQVAFAGVSIRMPYVNPAGVTYVGGAYQAGLPLQYAAATPFLRAAPVVSAAHAIAPAVAPVAYSAPVAYAAPAYKYAAAVAPVAQVAAPLAYPAHVKYAAPVAPVAYAAPVKYHAPIAYAAPLKYAAVPAVKTRKYEIRRPAIQKQFYDIEERVVVRPAGSALVELEEPLSKTQKGPALVRPAAVAVAAPLAVAAPVARVHYTPTFGLPLARTGLTSVHYGNPALVVQSGHYHVPQFGASNITQPQPLPFPELTQQPQQPQEQEQEQGPEEPQQPIESPQQSQSDEDSVSIDNPEISFRSSAPSTPAPTPAAAQEQSESTPAPAQESEQPSEPSEPSAPQSRSGQAGSLIVNYPSPYDLIPRGRLGSSVVPSVRNLPEISQANQQRLIQLLTARGGVTEVGLGRSGPAAAPVGDAGQVRARVLSATPSPPHSEPAGERVNTRRVVVSRPIETLQEFEVSEPVTKIVGPVAHAAVPVAHAAVPVAHAAVPVAHAAVPVAHAALPVARAYHTAVPAYSSHYNYFG